MLIFRRSLRGFSATFLPQHEVHPPHGVLLRFVERQDPRGATSDLVREDRFGSVYQEEQVSLIGLVTVVRMDHSTD